MPRTTINPTTLLGPYPALPVTAGSLAGAETAADVANKNQFPMTGREILVWRNMGATPHTVTLTSRADAQGRSGDVTGYSVAAGGVGAFDTGGPPGLEGWRQVDGMFYFEANHAEILFSVWRHAF